MALPLSHDSIAAGLPTRLVGRQIVIYKSTASTNDLAWQYAADAGKDGLAVFAENQTAGRGRHGNKWLGGQSRSILCSILLLSNPLEPDLLTLAAGVAVARAIGDCGRQKVGLKWPNDVTLGDRKAAGILIESRRLRAGAAHVIGIGINCCHGLADFPAELADSSTSIELATGAPCDRNTIARRLLVELDEWVAGGKGSQAITDAWLQLSTQLHRRVSLQHDGHAYTGTCIGIDPQNGFIVQLDGGAVRMFSASHTHTVRTT
jgi:BirA family transcriptional regulator, biotin operon repressor / biotin---[acetyl-CoA-carboxylase] ligase